jgi:hypothetical protein
MDPEVPPRLLIEPADAVAIAIPSGAEPSSRRTAALKQLPTCWSSTTITDVTAERAFCPRRGRGLSIEAKEPPSVSRLPFDDARL